MASEPYVDIKGLAKHFAVSETTIRKWLRQDLIPVLKLDGVHRFKISEVEQALLGINADEAGAVVDTTDNFDPSEDL